MTRSSTLLIVLVTASTITACDKPEDTADTAESSTDLDYQLPFGFESTLFNTQGCGDTELFAANDEDTLVLSFVVSGTAEDSWDAGVPTTTSYDLPSAFADLKVEWGSDVSQLRCNDAVEQAPEIRSTWLPTSGTATLIMTPTGSEYSPTEYPTQALLTINNVSFMPEVGNGGAISVADFSMSATVGWWPG